MPSSDRDRAPILAGVVGWPIEHSLSPLIHTIWAYRAKIDGHYIPLAVPPDYDSFARTMDSLRVVGFAGVNITIPHKEYALRYADSVSDTAEKVGAANMLTFRETVTYAENSDVFGFQAAIKENAIEPSTFKNSLVLGAGGAARGIVLALKETGVKELKIANRTKAKAERLAEQVGGCVIDWNDKDKAVEAADIIINTTSLGMKGAPPLPLDLSSLKSDAVVADIVYAPLETPLLRSAREKGVKTIDGLFMLMHQAAPGFKTWFGGPAEVDDALRTELVRELKRRSS